MADALASGASDREVVWVQVPSPAPQVKPFETQALEGLSFIPNISYMKRSHDMIKSLSVKNQSIETSGITKDYKEAICEYIWNGFEANATEVRITHSINPTGSLDSITISDNGDGIDYNDLSETFGAFLASRKNSLSLNIKSKSNKGKGRFSFTVFSSLAVWNTI